MKNFRKIGLVIIGFLVVVVVAMRLDLSTEDLPLPGNIDAEREHYDELSQDLAVRKKKRAEYNKKKERLRQRADRFWPAKENNPKVTVQSSFQKMAREAHVTIDNMGGVQISDVSDYIRKVQFSIRLQTSMQEFSRLLAQLQESSYPLFWDRCRIRPDDPRDPKEVRISGRLKTYVLTPAATEFIYGEEQEGES